MPAYLHHVTLTTGHARRSARAEITAEAIDFFRRWLDGPGDELRLPPNPDLYRLTAGRTGRCLHAAIWQGATLLITIGVAAHSRCGARLWAGMHEGSPLPLATEAEECPPEPWVAARIEAGLALYPEAAQWLGDLERCLGWAWIEHVEARRTR